MRSRSPSRKTEIGCPVGTTNPSILNRSSGWRCTLMSKARRMLACRSPITRSAGSTANQELYSAASRPSRSKDGAKLRRTRSSIDLRARPRSAIRGTQCYTRFCSPKTTRPTTASTYFSLSPVHLLDDLVLELIINLIRDQIVALPAKLAGEHLLRVKGVVRLQARLEELIIP